MVSAMKIMTKEKIRCVETITYRHAVALKEEMCMQEEETQACTCRLAVQEENHKE